MREDRQCGEESRRYIEYSRFAPQAFRHRWVRGRIAKERAGKRTMFGCTVLEEVEGARGSDDTRTVETSYV